MSNVQTTFKEFNNSSYGFDNVTSIGFSNNGYYVWELVLILVM